MGETPPPPLEGEITREVLDHDVLIKRLDTDDVQICILDHDTMDSLLKEEPKERDDVIDAIARFNERNKDDMFLGVCTTASALTKLLCTMDHEKTDMKALQSLVRSLKVLYLDTAGPGVVFEEEDSIRLEVHDIMKAFKAASKVFHGKDRWHKSPFDPEIEYMLNDGDLGFSLRVKRGHKVSPESVKKLKEYLEKEGKLNTKQASKEVQRYVV